MVEAGHDSAEPHDYATFDEYAAQPRRWLSAWPSRQLQRLGLRLAGAGLLTATGAIHLDLYMNGYRSIPTIGGLFLLQVSAVFCVAGAVLVSGSRLLAAVGAGLALATLGAYLQSVWIGLFGFKEVRSTAGIAAGVVEVAAFAVLAGLALAPAAPAQQAWPAIGGRRLLAWLEAGTPGAGRIVVGVSVAALVVFGVSVARASGRAPAPVSGARAFLHTARIGGVTVLTNASGFTLYWFARDTPTRSNCNGVCVGYWPPVSGSPSAGPGVAGTIGSIRRSDGMSQVTYDGHPLYTYVGDTAPGQAFGNNVNLNGGLWHEVTVPG
jgi:predicted lipoprotein with Yx(FWY)xxD motif